MSRAARTGLALAAALAGWVGTTGCETAGRAIEAPPATPPLAAMVLPPSFLTPRSRQYRLAVREFVDQTGQAPGPAYSAGEVLVTALHAGNRFELYDIRGEASVEVSDDEAAPRTTVPGDYRSLQGVVDGVLESSVTGVSADARGNGRIEVDYRVVDPYTRMVVSSGSARVGLQGGGLLRKDVAALARAVSRPFIAPDVLAEYGVEVREVELDGEEVKLTLSAGSDQQLRRGFVGFVYEEDRHARIERYLAKFVIVNVFPEAAVGVVVDHCNAVDRCGDDQRVAAVEQAKSIHVGSRVRFK